MRTSSRVSLVVGIAVVVLAGTACGQPPPPYELSAADCTDVLASVDAGRAQLVAYERASGRELWTADGGFGDVPPATRADVVYLVRTSPAGDHSDLVVLDAATGTTRWTSRVDGPVQASFVVSYGVDSVAVATSNFFGPYAILDPSGRRADQPWALVTGTVVPLGAGRSGRLITSRTTLALVDPDEGTELWRTEVPASAGPATDIDVDLVRVGDVLVVPTGGLPSGISGVDTATGRVLWTHVGTRLPLELLGGRSSSPPVVVLVDDREVLVLAARTGQRLDVPADEVHLDVEPNRYLDDVRPDWSPPDGRGDVIGSAVDGSGRGFVLRSSDQPASTATRALHARCSA